MYSITIESGFSAVHRVARPDGSLEPLNGHDWRVSARYEAASLNQHGMVVDFTLAREALDALLATLHHTDLNEHPALAAAPTAEVVARWLFDKLSNAGPPGLACLAVTEAPGCTAAYAPPRRSRDAE